MNGLLGGGEPTAWFAERLRSQSSSLGPWSDERNVSDEHLGRLCCLFGERLVNCRWT